MTAAQNSGIFSRNVKKWNIITPSGYSSLSKPKSIVLIFRSKKRKTFFVIISVKINDDYFASLRNYLNSKFGFRPDETGSVWPYKMAAELGDDERRFFQY